MTRCKVTAEQSTYKLELLAGETVVSYLYVAPFQQRIGSAWVRMGGIAGVNTPAPHRQKGYASELMRNAIDWMKKEEYHWSGLFGIPDFYHRFGYVAALPESRLIIPTRYAEETKSYYGIRPWQDSDTPAILAIYALTNAQRTGSVGRATETWKGFRRGTSWTAIPTIMVAEDQAGQVVGYAVYDKYTNGVAVAEIAALAWAGYESLVHHLAQLAVERRAESITLHVPPDHPVARLCQQLGCSYTVNYPIRRSGMWRLLNQTAFLQAVEAELSQRLSQAGWRQKLNLTIATELEKTALIIDGRRLHIETAVAPAMVATDHEFNIQVSQTNLTQAMMGYIPLREALERQLEGVNGKNSDGSVFNTGGLPPLLAEVCDIIFPRQFATLWLPDHF